MTATDADVVARPRTRAWIALGAAIACEVTASLSLKGALDHPLLYAVVVAGYATAFVLLAGALRDGLALGVAYGIWGASGVALTALLSTLVFGEPVTPLMLGGIVLIVAGVLCIELGSHAGARRDGRSADAA